MTEPNKTKDLEHKLGNLILMTRPLRRQVASSTKPTTEPQVRLAAAANLFWSETR